MKQEHPLGTEERNGLGGNGSARPEAPGAQTETCLGLTGLAGSDLQDPQATYEAPPAADPVALRVSTRGARPRTMLSSMLFLACQAAHITDRLEDACSRFVHLESRLEAFH